MWFPRVTRKIIAWIVRGVTIAWPPQSPDLTTIDFPVWGYVKDNVWKNYGCDRRYGHDF
jgi:hypothetical protein